MSQYQKLVNNDQYLAYHKISSAQNNKPGLVFLAGFKSDMNGTKSQAILNYAQKNDYDLLRFDYLGHGNSSEKFIDGTIGTWLQNTLDIIDNLTDKPQILIGSSMGGWIMLLAALARPEKICGLIGLAAAPDFTEELIWNYMTSTQKETLLDKKQIDFSNEFCEDAYPISSDLIMEARNHLLLDKKINLDIPISLIHGMNDKDVPYSTSIRIAENIAGNDVQVHLLKKAGHRLSNPDELEFIYQEITKLAQLSRLDNN